MQKTWTTVQHDGPNHLEMWLNDPSQRSAHNLCTQCPPSYSTRWVAGSQTLRRSGNYLYLKPDPVFCVALATYAFGQVGRRPCSRRPPRRSLRPCPPSSFSTSLSSSAVYGLSI